MLGVGVIQLVLNVVMNQTDAMGHHRIVKVAVLQLQYFTDFLQ